MELLGAGFIYLLAAVIAVPVANRLGLGSVLGYLVAGVVIGPLLGLVGAETEQVQHFAEFGVVMMLFLVGLELRPALLWRMRGQLLGLGGLQVVLTLAAFSGIGLAFGLAWQTALTVGMILALSSTAIVLQTLNEKGWMRTGGGQASFSVLLSQDIAVIPMLGLLPLLAISGHGERLGEIGEAAVHGPAGGPLDSLPGWAHALAVLAVIASILIAGRYLMRPIFRFIAQSRLREIFTAAALLLVIGTALLMDMVGLSPALGTFLAGVVLSESEYRHELESDIDPFKGLLLGLFFLTVGAGINFDLLFAQPALLVGMALGILVLKAAILFALASAFQIRGTDRWLFALGLAQAGEFAFVLFGFAQDSGALPAGLAENLVLVVAITMLLTPVFFIIYEKVIAPRVSNRMRRDADEIDASGPVVVAGMGRMGQVITRLLMTNGYQVVLLDHDPDRIDTLSKLGVRAYYGDATRPDLLKAAGLEQAKLFVAAIDNRDKQTQMVAHVAKTYPQVRIHARAQDRHHVYDLELAGAHTTTRETFESALSMGRGILTDLGLHPYRAEVKTRQFRAHDLTTLNVLRGPWNEAGFSGVYIDALRAQSDALYDVMRMDRGDRHDETEKGWMPPLIADPAEE